MVHAGIALGLAVLLVGCAPTVDRKSSVESAPKKPAQSAPKKPSESELARLLVNQLQSECSGLTEFTANSSNWLFTFAETGTSPYEMGLSGGDGGNVVLMVTPKGSNGVTLAISPEWADSTNIILWNSGCSSLASPPADSGSGISGNSGETGGNEVYTFELPNFIGYTQNDVEDWFWSNGISARPYFDYGFNPMVSCEVSGDGPVIGQNPGGGAVIEDVSSTRVSFEIDCDW
jgi:hypothetical protein